MRIFVTGGTGFIGTHFIQMAIKEGHEVFALARNENLARKNLVHQPTWIEGSLDSNLEKFFTDIDIFVHMASHTANPPYDVLSKCLYWNVFASLKLAEQAYLGGVKLFLIAGSCFEYGKSAEDYEFLSPDTHLEPMLSYPISKASASLAFEGFSREHNVSLKILRIFQVYGDGEHEKRMWPSLRKAALNGEDFLMSTGDQLRDFVNVTEVAEKFVSHLDFSNTKPGTPEVYHVCSGYYQSLLEFANEWWKTWGASGKILAGVIPDRKNEMKRIIPLGSVKRFP
jgi:nucleoside-diphosphate-sugar epimerase